MKLRFLHQRKLFSKEILTLLILVFLIGSILVLNTVIKQQQKIKSHAQGSVISLGSLSVSTTQNSFSVSLPFSNDTNLTALGSMLYKLHSSTTWSTEALDRGFPQNSYNFTSTYIPAMPIISRGVPAFASSTTGSNQPSFANDNDYIQTYWSSGAFPAWIAYDLSSVPTVQRGKVAFVFWTEWRDVYDPWNAPNVDSPSTFSIEANAQAGGSTPPVSGWVSLKSFTNNTFASIMQDLDLTGYNWIRLNIQTLSDGATSGYNLRNMDVYNAANGNSDSWLFIGNSVPSGVWSDSGHTNSVFEQYIAKFFPQNYPVKSNGGVAGESLDVTNSYIDEILAKHTDRFVTVEGWLGNYDGTLFYNSLDSIISKIIAAGKVPIIPTIISSPDNISSGRDQYNTLIQQLYAKYPQVVQGPDLWFDFKDRPEFFPDLLHPDSAGQALYQQATALNALTLLYAKNSSSILPTSGTWSTTITGLTAGDQYDIKVLVSDPTLAASTTYTATIIIGGGSVTTTPSPTLAITSTPIPTPTITVAPTPTPTRTPTPVPTTTPQPTTIATLTPTPVSTKLSLTIGLDGIGKAGDNVNRSSTGNTSPFHPQRTVTLILSDQNNIALPAISGSISYDSVSGLFKGTVSLPTTVTSGVYTLKVASPSFLQRAITAILTITQGQTTIVPTSYLVAGDINNDNQIGLLDYNLLLGCFGSSVSSCSPSDLDDTGSVGGSDYNLFLRELSVQIGG